MSVMSSVVYCWMMVCAVFGRSPVIGNVVIKLNDDFCVGLG